MAEVIPESWDTDNASIEESPAISLEKPLGSLSFNPNATAFVPGKNVHANTFVPSGPAQPPVVHSKSQPCQSEPVPASSSRGKYV